MFNEIYSSGTTACPEGMVNDFDPATGQFSALCVDDTAAYRGEAKGKPSGINVTPKPADAWTNYAIYGGLALIGALLIFGGRRR